MSTTVKKHKAFAASKEDMFAKAQTLIPQLDPKAKVTVADGKLQLKTIFGKQVGGEYVNDRSQMDVAVIDGSEGGCVVISRAFPINAVGQPLTFGVRSNIGERIVDMFLNGLGE